MSDPTIRGTVESMMAPGQLIIFVVIEMETMPMVDQLIYLLTIVTQSCKKHEFLLSCLLDSIAAWYIVAHRKRDDIRVPPTALVPT